MGTDDRIRSEGPGQRPPCGLTVRGEYHDMRLRRGRPDRSDRSQRCCRPMRGVDDDDIGCHSAQHAAIGPFDDRDHVEARPFERRYEVGREKRLRFDQEDAFARAVSERLHISVTIATTDMVYLVRSDTAAKAPIDWRDEVLGHMNVAPT